MCNELESFIILRPSLHGDRGEKIYDPSAVNVRKEWPTSAQPKIVSTIEELAVDTVEIEKLQSTI